MRTIDPALERVWELMRHDHADIIIQPLPARLLQLLDALEQKERAFEGLKVEAPRDPNLPLPD